MTGLMQTTNRGEFAARRAGVYLLGSATVAAGILDLIWGDFDPGHQPIQAIGTIVPGRTILAYTAAIWMILAGGSLLWRRTARNGALAVAAIYFIFGLFSMPRFYTMTHKLGFHITLILGVIGEMLLQFVVVAGCLVLYSSLSPPASHWRAKSRFIARVTFGLGGALFGMGHLVNVRGVVHLIPKWMPFGAPFWVVVSGIAFALAGIAILSGILDVLASWLLTLMLFIFEIALLPIIVAFPHLHQAWGASAYNMTVAGAVWIYAVSIARSEPRKEPIATKPLLAEVS